MSSSTDSSTEVNTYETPDPEFLEEWHREVLQYIERYHSVSGKLPSDHDIYEYLHLSMGRKDFKPEYVRYLKKSQPFIKSCESRGLVINTGETGQIRDVKSLTERQMAAVATMLNWNDRRSDEKKLRDIGISTEEYSTWLQDDRFIEYMHGRTEKLLEHSTHEAHIGLLRGLKQGNTSSIKLYYEMTGRYNPESENTLNIKVLIGQMLEIIQRVVKDPDTLNRLALEFSQAALISPVAEKKPVSILKAYDNED